MRLSKKWVLILFLQVPLFHILGQSLDFKNYNYNIKYHSGFILKHNEFMAHLANQRPSGIEIDLYKKTTGKKLWQQIHNYPFIGYSFQYFIMDKSKPVGNSYSAIIYYGKPILKTPKSTFYFRLGVGLGYMEKPYDINTNYKNNLISTRINFTLNGRINYSYAINDHWNINTGIGLLHLSNGAFKVPNLGINIPSAHIGFGYCPQQNQTFIKSDILKQEKSTNLNITIAGGLKQVYPVDGPFYFISTLSTYLNKRLNHQSALNIGTDLFYDGSCKKNIDTLTSGKQKIKYYKWGATVGHELYIGDISFLTQVGYYLYDPLKLNKKFYQRLALKYYLTDSVFGIVALKLHLGQADLVEWGVGVKI